MYRSSAILVLVIGCVSSLAAQTVYRASPNRLPNPTAPRVVYTPPQVERIPARVVHDRQGNVIYQPARVVYQAPEITTVQPHRRRGVLYDRVTVAHSPLHVRTYERPRQERPRPRPRRRLRHRPGVSVRIGGRRRSCRPRRWSRRRPVIRIRPSIGFHFDL